MEVENTERGIVQNLGELVKAKENQKQKLKLSLLKQQLINSQEQFFKQLSDQADTTNLEIAHRAVTRVTERIQNKLMSKKSPNMYSPINYSKRNDKSADLSLERLDIEKCQPNLRLIIYEENIKKQQQAQNFITRLKTQQTKQENLRRMIQFQKEKERIKLQDEQNRSLEEIYFRKQEKHHKLSLKITEIKQKCKQRIEDMMLIEEEYFKGLEEKLSKFNRARSYLKEKSYNHIQLKIGVKSEHKVCKVEIEEPLYMRYRNEYNEKIEKEHKKKLIELDQMLKNKQKFNNLNYQEHAEKYATQKQQLQQHFESQRIDALKNLGLIKQQGNESFDTNLWILNKRQKQMEEEEIKNKQRERSIRLKSYFEYIKDFKGTLDQQKRLELLVTKDKLENPKKYIRPLRRKRLGDIGKSDVQIYLESLQKEIQKMNPGHEYFFQRNLGNNYLFELELKNAMKRQKSEKSRHEQQVKNQENQVIGDELFSKVIQKISGEVVEEEIMNKVLSEQMEKQEIEQLNNIAITDFIEIFFTKTLNKLIFQIQDEEITQQNNQAALEDFSESFLTQALIKINHGITEEIVEDEKKQQNNIIAITDCTEQFFKNSVHKLIVESAEEVFFLDQLLKQQSMNIIVNSIKIERNTTNSISQLEAQFISQRERKNKIKLKYHSQNEIDWKKVKKGKRNLNKSEVHQRL